MNSHIVKVFYETRALLTLQYLFEKEFQNAIHYEKPDILVSNDYGIEVTRAINKAEEEKSAFFTNRMAMKQLSKIDRKKLGRFVDDGTKILHKNGLVYGYSPVATWFNSDVVVETIYNKLLKLNKLNYDSCNHMSLYVFSNSFRQYEKEDMQEILADVMSFQTNYDKMFEELFFDDCGWFYRCDLTTGYFSFYNTDNILSKINFEAKEITEKTDL